jgi:hypothetical protein
MEISITLICPSALARSKFVFLQVAHFDRATNLEGEAMTDRNSLFQHLVLNGIWMLALLIMGFKHRAQIVHSWRDGAIMFGDQYGVQGDEAKRVRREMTYWKPQDL